MICLSYKNKLLKLSESRGFLVQYLLHAALLYWQLISCHTAWRRYQMETVSALLAICAGNSPVPGELPAQRPVTRSFDVFFDLRLNKRLSKQSWRWWFETLSRPLWLHRNGIENILLHYIRQVLARNVWCDSPAYHAITNCWTRQSHGPFLINHQFQYMKYLCCKDW